MNDAGKVGIAPKGPWNSNTTYEMLDCVSYSSCAWLARKPSTNVPPTEGEYWMYMCGIADMHNFVLKTDYATTDDYGIVKLGSGLEVDASGRVNVVGGSNIDTILCVLDKDEWEDNQQIVNVSGITADSDGVMGMSSTVSQEEIDEFYESGITVKSIGTNRITFECETVPSMDFDIYIMIASDNA